MSGFAQYPFNANYIKSYNLIKLGEAKYNLYTEDDSDRWFWEKFIEKLLPNKYRILSLTKRGKRALEPYYCEAKREALIAVDSDYDYLCSNIGYGNEFLSNPYLLHTFAYSRESVLIEQSYIQEFLADIKYTINHEIDIETFLQQFSALIFDGLIKFIHLKNFEKVDLDHDSFHKCFHLTDKNMVIISSQGKPILDMSILSDISTNLQYFFDSHFISQAEYNSTKSHLNHLGVNYNNAYRFIDGHELESLVVKMLKQLTDTLLSLEMPAITQDFSGIEIPERRTQVKSILEEESSIKSYLRRYPICDNDEIHQKILAKIQNIQTHGR